MKITSLEDLQGSRYDCLLVWGHGLQYLRDIVDKVQCHPDFNVLKVQRFFPRDIKTFVNQVYSFDYAPLVHLKMKTKYLRSTNPEVCFVFFKNSRPDEDYVDEGSYRHLESMTLKAFKNEIRERYNPRRNGVMTHEHVIHTTDCEQHADTLLKLIGYNEGIGVFEGKGLLVNIPYHIHHKNEYLFYNVELEKLTCNVLINEPQLYNTQINYLAQSPQYRGVSESMSEYKNYIDRYFGYGLQDYYSSEKYQHLIDYFDYDRAFKHGDYVLVKRLDNNCHIVDGLHRSAVAMATGMKTIKVCEICE